MRSGITTFVFNNINICFKNLVMFYVIIVPFFENNNLFMLSYLYSNY